MLFISVVSGKGGVGKSTVAALIASKLCQRAPTLLLDFDICGPSIGSIFGVSGKVIKTRNGLRPLRVMNSMLYVLSMSSLIKKEDSIIWRDPRKLQLLEMFYNSSFEKIVVENGDKSLLSDCSRSSNGNGEQNEASFEYVVIDTPPGITIVHSFIKDKQTEVILVTTSQNVALSDSINTIRFFDNISGVVENMAGLKCPNCSKVTNLFSKNGGSLLAHEFSIPFLGSIEIDKDIINFIQNSRLPNSVESLRCNGTLNNIVEQIIKKQKQCDN